MVSYSLGRGMIMYIDGVIAMSLVVIIVIMMMMVYLYRYANRHIEIDERKAKQLDGNDNSPLSVDQ